MSADRKLAEIVAEGRRLIAEATADRVLPLKKTVCEGYNTLIEADGTPLARTDGDGSAYVEDCAVDVVAFAVAHLPALLDVAEAAAAVQPAMQCYRDSGGYHPYRALLDKHDALDAALAALALGPDGEGKEKSNG